MRNAILSALLFLTLITGSVGASGNERENIAIITNVQNTQSLSKHDIQNIFLDRTITWENGKKIDIYNLPVAAYGRELFSRQILDMSAQEAAAAEANRKITNTYRNPQIIKRDRLIPYLVAHNPNAIAYARESSIHGKTGIRVIMVLTPD